MPKITQNVLVEDFYKTTLSAPLADSGDLEVEVATPPSNTKGFIIVNPDNISGRERMYYHNVVGSTIYVRGVNRIEPKEHLAQDTVQINDTSLIFNYLSKLQSTTFYIEQTGLLDIKVWGGPVLRGIETISVSDTDLTLSASETNYIYYKASTNEIKFATSEGAVTTDKGIIVAEIPTGSTEIASISYRQHKLTNCISIESVVLTSSSPDGLVDTYTITYTEGSTSTFDVTNGNGIDSIDLTSTSGPTKTYTITFDDGTTTAFDVKDGTNIDTIELTSSVLNVDTYTVTLTDGSTTTFEVTNGTSIQSIAKTGTVGLVDTYTITLTDNSQTTFEVTNGEDGLGVPAGGTAAQVLAKIDGTDNNTEWKDMGFQDAPISLTNNVDYLAAKSGIVVAYGVLSFTTHLYGYVGATSADTLIADQQQGDTANNAVSICFPVKAGQYYKVNSTGGTPTASFYPLN